jgi:hypothetical protein
MSSKPWFKLVTAREDLRERMPARKKGAGF